MSYHEEYKKYKKMYIDLKNQNGGDNMNDWIKNNFNISKTDVDYLNIIQYLKSYCSEKISTINQIKDKLKDLYNVLGNKLAEYNIPNIFDNKQSFDLRNIKWNDYHIKVCETLEYKIIPELEKERNLQKKLINKFSELSINTRINIDKYIEYAKNKKILDKPVDQILQEYNLDISNYAKYFNNEILNNKIIMSSLSLPVLNRSNIDTVTSDYYPNTSNMEMANSLPLLASNNMRFDNNTSINPDTLTSDYYPQVLSKNGKVCKTACQKQHSLFKGDYCSCKTDPYKSLFTSYDWDYCQESKCANL